MERIKELWGGGGGLAIPKRQSVGMTRLHKS